MDRPIELTKQAQLFLDCDGVLADFDTRAEEVFGLPPRQAEERFGTQRFWVDLQSHPNFYRDLPLLPDAMKLYEAVKHLSPIILTGCPQGGWAEPQKLDWAAKNFPGVKMITCLSKDKRLHMKIGDVLIDDWPKYKHLWEEHGGRFVLHTSAEESIAQLREIGMLPGAVEGEQERPIEAGNIQESIIAKLDSVKMVRHDSPETLLATYWKVPVEELGESSFGGGHALDCLAEDYNPENEVPASEILDGIRESGFYGFGNCNENQLHYWLDDSKADEANLVHFFAHELAHLLKHADAPPEKEVVCEVEAEYFGLIAKRAHVLAMRSGETVREKP